MGRKIFRQAMGPCLLVAVAFGDLLSAKARAEDVLGTVLSFDISEELRTRSNPGLETPAADRESLARTHLGFGLTSATATQKLNLSLNGALEAGKDGNTGISDPDAQFSFRHESKASALEFSSFLHESSVDTLDFILSGTPDTPIFSFVDGTGTQRRVGATTSLELGRDRSVGATFSVGETRTTYHDTTDPSLTDSRRDTGKANFRFDLSPSLTLTTTAVLARRTEENAPSKDSSSLSFGLSDSRPDGHYDIDVSFNHTESGDRQSLTFGRSRDLLSGDVSVRLGLVHGETGKINVIGGLDWSQELTRGKLSMALDRNVVSDDDDEETRTTRLSMALTQDLTARLTGGINIGLQDSTETVSDISRRTAEVTASLNYGLTADWGLRVGATHRDRNRSDGADARTTDAFVTLSRHFEYRP